ncbi:MAG: hypothetical protein LDL10_03680 [Calditerrivibrio sp.]|nr:hypothetical protein [Calditerrivibrio sp.]MCA1980617.1 hypothetical protein [Calditerrivibrio sp.]
MAVEGPYIAAVIGRLPEVKENLAGYSIAYSVGLLVESPIIMLMSASTALVNSKESYIKLRNFTFMLISFLTIIIIIILIKPVFNFVFSDILGINEKILKIVYPALVGLIPWSGAIGYRRFYQGIIIKHGKTKHVAFGTTVRLFTIVFGAIILSRYTTLKSAVLGAVTLSLAVIAEAAITRFFASQSIRNVCLKSDSSGLSYGNIASFYFPMAITPLIALSVPPMTTFFLLKGKNPMESVAVMPVLNSLTFVFRAVGLSFQEVSIALMDKENKNFIKIRNFVRGLIVFNLVSYGMISFTPLSHFYFEIVSGLTPDLSETAIIPARILTFIPPLTVLLAFQRSIIVKIGNTVSMTVATMIEVFVAFSILFLIPLLDIQGVVLASLALLIGRICGNTYLYFVTIKIAKR